MPASRSPPPCSGWRPPICRRARASGGAWILAQALETLGVLGSVGENNAVFQAMLKTVADDKLPFLVRSAAADSLGRLELFVGQRDQSRGNGGHARAVCGRRLCTTELQLAKKAGTPVCAAGCCSVSTPCWLAALERRRRPRPQGNRIAGARAESASVRRRIAEDDQGRLRSARRQSDDEDKDMKPVVEELQKNLKAWLQKKPK